MWQRFTERARKVVFYAQEEAERFGEGYVSTEHLLLGLLREDDTVASRVLEKFGVSLKRARTEVEKQLPSGENRPSQDMTLTPRAKRVIDLAYDEARNLNNNYIGTEHLLLGIIREGDGLAGRVLTKLGVELENARREVMKLQDQAPSPAENLPGPRKVAAHAPRGTEENILSFLMGQCLKHHLLLALIADEEGRAGKIIREQVADVGALQWNLWQLIGLSSKPGIHTLKPESVENILAAAQTEAGGNAIGG
ncbi:MAG: Clp protease N-terminal domain-containing protein, partial [Fimbriimonadales bacterium]